MYIDAAETAASSNVKLLVYPEGYGLVGSPSKTSFYEPLAVIVGSSPCGKLNASTHPIQAKLGCAAANYSIALGANLFTAQKNGSHYITEVIFSQNGTVLAIYHKHELFPIEEPKVSLKKPHPPKSIHGVYHHSKLIQYSTKSFLMGCTTAELCTWTICTDSLSV